MWCQLQKAMQNYALLSQSWHGLFSFSCPSALVVLVWKNAMGPWGMPKKNCWFNMESEPQVDRRWFWVGATVTCYKSVQNLCLSLMGNLQNGSFTVSHLRNLGMPKSLGHTFRGKSTANSGQVQLTNSGSFSILLIPTWMALNFGAFDTYKSQTSKISIMWPCGFHFLALWQLSLRLGRGTSTQSRSPRQKAQPKPCLG